MAVGGTDAIADNSHSDELNQNLVRVSLCVCARAPS